MESRVPAEGPAAEGPTVEPKKVRVRKPCTSQQLAEVPEAAPAERKVRVRKPRAEPKAKTEIAGPPPLPVVDAPFFAAVGGTIRSLQRDDHQAKLSNLRIA